jgi:hypothetical protein
MSSSSSSRELTCIKDLRPNMRSRNLRCIVISKSRSGSGSGGEPWSMGRRRPPTHLNPMCISTPPHTPEERPVILKEGTHIHTLLIGDPTGCIVLSYYDRHGHIPKVQVGDLLKLVVSGIFHHESLHCRVEKGHELVRYGEDELQYRDMNMSHYRWREVEAGTWAMAERVPDLPHWWSTVGP